MITETMHDDNPVKEHFFLLETPFDAGCGPRIAPRCILIYILFGKTTRFLVIALSNMAKILARPEKTGQCPVRNAPLSSE